jgi:hypothetical protein
MASKEAGILFCKLGDKRGRAFSGAAKIYSSNSSGCNFIWVI